jgi:DNA-binding GntR family transcriptional regulator
LIAELSDEKEGRRRRELTAALYDFTKNMYHAASVALHKALAEHRGILMAIKSGHPEKARELMEKHLEEHYELAKENLLRNPPDRLDLRRRGF